MIPWIKELVVKLNHTSNRINSPNHKTKTGDIYIMPNEESSEYNGVTLINNRAEGNGGEGFRIEVDTPVRGYGNVAKDNQGKGFNIKR